MKEYKIRNIEDGAIECTGYFADSDEEAMDLFVEDHPAYSADDFYAAES